MTAAEQMPKEDLVDDIDLIAIRRVALELAIGAVGGHLDRDIVKTAAEFEKYLLEGAAE